MKRHETETFRQVLLGALQETCEDGEKYVSELSGARKSECEHHTKYLKQVLDAVRSRSDMYDLPFDFGTPVMLNWSRDSLAKPQTLKSPYALKDIFGEMVQRVFHRKEVMSINDFAELQYTEVEELYRSMYESAETPVPFLVRKLHENLQKHRKMLLPDVPLQLVA